jgi:protein tyrosine phosphatase
MISKVSWSFTKFLYSGCPKLYDSSECIRNNVFLFVSAGVGRTGVFITVETACCLIEAGVAVYPEQMLDTLRDQRPSLIQTPVRY